MSKVFIEVRGRHDLATPIHYEHSTGRRQIDYVTYTYCRRLDEDKTIFLMDCHGRHRGKEFTHSYPKAAPAEQEVLDAVERSLELLAAAEAARWLK